MLGDRADSQQHSNLIAGRAAAAFADGRFREAAEGWRRSGEMNVTDAPTNWPRAARALLWAGDGGEVRSVLALIDAPNLHGRIVDLSRRTVRAGLLALDGDREGAAREYGSILPQLADVGLVFERALVVLDMVRLLGPDAPIVRESVDEAREILDRLGARPYAARLEALMGGRPSEVHRVARVADPVDA